MVSIFPEELLLSSGDPPYSINLWAKTAGPDIVCTVTGGTHPHIGAVAFAEPAETVHPVTGEPVKRDGICVSVLTGEGHKDAVIAEMFAKGLCEKYGVNVCAAAGVHVDGAGREEITLLINNAELLLILAKQDSIGAHKL